MFKIQNVSGDDVVGATVFNYKDYVISMSTIFKPHDVAIIRHGEFIKTNISTVEEAIEFINNI